MSILAKKTTSTRGAQFLHLACQGAACPPVSYATGGYQTLVHSALFGETKKIKRSVFLIDAASRDYNRGLVCFVHYRVHEDT